MRLDAARGHFDAVMAWSVDQLGRSLQDFAAFLSELHALDMDLIVREQGIDTTATSGQAMHQLMGAFAEFGRSKLRERVTLAPETTSPPRTKLGRPPIPATVEIAIESDLRTNKGGIHAIAKRHGVGVGTVQRIKAALT
jgi:DNA invertase Pin-like site-specific DNA recombinase